MLDDHRHTWLCIFVTKWGYLICTRDNEPRESRAFDAFQYATSPLIFTSWISYLFNNLLIFFPENNVLWLS